MQRLPDFAEQLRSFTDRSILGSVDQENLRSTQLVDFARSFKCNECMKGERFGLCNESSDRLTTCVSCENSSTAGKLAQVEEYLRNYIEQLEEVIATSADSELDSLKETVSANPGGISLLGPDHYLLLRWSLARAKFSRRLGDVAAAGRHWRVFQLGAARLCRKLKK